MPETFHREKTQPNTLALCVCKEYRHEQISSSELNMCKSFSYLVRVWMQVPLSTSHNLTVESNEAEARTKLALGFWVPGPTN